MRIAIGFLKQIQEIFFSKFDSQQRSRAVAHQLKEFNKILKEKIEMFNNKASVDKLYSLKKDLTELEEISLRNMDKVIDRGEKI